MRCLWQLPEQFFPPFPLIPKLHLELANYVCLIYHSALTHWSDDAEYVWFPFLWLFLTHHFFSLRSEEFLSAFQDIWEHLKIIISKWSPNEGKGFCQIFSWELRVLAVMLHFICLFVQCQTWMLPKSDVSHNNWLGAGDANCSGLLKMHLTGVTNVCSQVKLAFSLFKSFFLSTFNFLCSWKRSDAALHLWRRIFVSRGKLQGI